MTIFLPCHYCEGKKSQAVYLVRINGEWLGFCDPCLDLVAADEIPDEVRHLGAKCPT